MISFIEGELIFKKNDYVFVKCNGVGFKVFVHSDLGEIGEKVRLFSYLAVKEDSLSLYGFSTFEEMELFEVLISVSGVGPKSGMGILSLASVSAIKTAIVRQEPEILTKVSGIGKKTADRVILELKNKFCVDDISDSSECENMLEHTDALDALMGLGYSQKEARKALSEISKDESIEEKIRLALKYLGNKK